MASADLRKFTAFIAVGIVNTAFGYTVYAVILYFGYHYAYAALFATVLGVLFNFKTIGSIVFKTSDYSLFGKFVLVYAVIYAVNVAGLKLCSMMSMNLYVAGIALVPLMAVLSYVLNSRIVFKRNEPPVR